MFNQQCAIMNLVELRAAAARNNLDPGYLVKCQVNMAYHLGDPSLRCCPYVFGICEIETGDDEDFSALIGMDLHLDRIYVDSRKVTKGDWLIYPIEKIPLPFVVSEAHFEMIFKDNIKNEK